MPRPYRGEGYPPRPSARQRGYITAWDKARQHYLRKHPLCVMCMAQGHVVVATVVDHKISHKGDHALFWDTNNWQALCEAHHASTKQSIDRIGYDHAIDDHGWPLDEKHPANKIRK
jgi:5-methylcytosine-specific restriction enzyme A